jgi:hypothetical protein
MRHRSSLQSRRVMLHGGSRARCGRPGRWQTWESLPLGLGFGSADLPANPWQTGAFLAVRGSIKLWSWIGCRDFRKQLETKEIGNALYSQMPALRYRESERLGQMCGYRLRGATSPDLNCGKEDEAGEESTALPGQLLSLRV